MVGTLALHAAHNNGSYIPRILGVDLLDLLDLLQSGFPDSANKVR